MAHWILYAGIFVLLLLGNIYYVTHRKHSERELLEEVIERLKRIEDKLK
jgi:hypothetical protein